jgi:tRNA dimethylallyltransferase
LSTVSSSNPDNLKQKVVLVFGPTAVGKTDILTELFGTTGEVISADSMQAYRGMDVGTAKPGRSVLDTLSHHLIDIRDPDEQYNAGDFVTEADKIVHDIAIRRKIPIVSGGTPFYLRNFIFGLPETPASDPAVRAQIESEIKNMGLDSAYDYLATVDPETAARISPRDTYRVARAIEVFRGTGKKLSSFSVSHTRRNVFDMLLIGLDRPREELNRRIELRVGMMFEQGLVSELKSLIHAGYGEDAPGMQGIGYREFFRMRKNGCTTLSGVGEHIIRNTRKYAKRQRTFFKRFPATAWFHPDDTHAISDAIRGFLD